MSYTTGFEYKENLEGFLSKEHIIKSSASSGYIQANVGISKLLKNKKVTIKVVNDLLKDNPIKINKTKRTPINLKEAKNRTYEFHINKNKKGRLIFPTCLIGKVVILNLLNENKMTEKTENKKKQENKSLKSNLPTIKLNSPLKSNINKINQKYSHYKIVRNV